MSETSITYPSNDPVSRIITVRGQKVVLDSDLARLYGVGTKVLNQAIKRNIDKFPVDFMFQITPQEAEELRAECVTTATGSNRSQIVTGSQKHRDPRHLPYAFTEHGAIMVATVLNSPQAVQMSVFVVRAFVKMREQFMKRAELEKRLCDIETTLTEHDAVLRELVQKIRPLLLASPEPTRKRIGFRVNESHAAYRACRKRPAAPER